MSLFTADIHGWNAWGQTFQSIDAFRPLIQQIYQQTDIPCPSIAHLTPGTNAVFQVGQTIIKIYAPLETGITVSEYPIELSAMERAASHGVLIPKIYDHGLIRDTYNFHYIIMEYIDAPEAGQVLPQYSIDSKQAFIQDLIKILQKINLPADGDAECFRMDQIQSSRWSDFSEAFQQSRIQRLQQLSLDSFVYVHGDLTAENVLIDHGQIRIIDFGDAQIAPYYYEYGPIVADLLDCDPMLVQSFAKGRQGFTDDVVNGILVHQFGSNILQHIARKHSNLRIEQWDKTEQITMFLRTLLSE